MKRITAAIASLALLALATPSAHAAEMKDMSEMKGMPGMKMDADKSAAGQAHKGRGTVNSVDAKAGKVNLTHGPVPSLNWPAMTMDFQVRDPALLKDVAPGQNIEFDLVQGGKNQYVITRIALPAGKK